MQDKAVVFVKAPRPGTVKTRLAAAIGAIPACEAYRSLVATVLERLAGLDAVELRFAPDDAQREIAPWLRPGWVASPQGKGDLGERLERTFVEGFARGARRIVVIGSDCPDIESSDIQEAWRQLLRHDVVLGPAVDGGYWLIGLRGNHPSLFRGVSWGSDQVLQQTRQSAQQLGLGVHLLGTLRDVDTVDDWNDWRRSRGE